MDTTIDNNQTATDSKNIDEKLNILADGLKSTHDMVLKYAETLNNFFTGQEKAKTAQSATSEKRGRGRPRTRSVPPPAIAKAETERVLHPLSMEILNIVNKEGRIKGSEVSAKIKQSRSLTYYHVRPLIEQGKIVQRRCYNGGVPFDVFYRADRAIFRD